MEYATTLRDLTTMAVYFRSTKERRRQSQGYLKIKSTTNHASHESEDVYVHTYGMKLPGPSYDILLPCVSGFTNNMSAPNTDIRALHTIGVWSSASGNICRCAFIQPEVATATCNILAAKSQAAIMAKKILIHNVPWAEECRISSEEKTVKSTGVNPRTPQISGRMAPYVVAEAGLDRQCNWVFGNLCKTKIIFLMTSIQEVTVLTLTRLSMMILKHYMPSYATCIYDDDMSCYMITVAPDAGGDSSVANKNTSLVIYGDGAIKLQGTPSKMGKVCGAMNEAIHTIATSRSWERFLTSMSVVNALASTELVQRRLSTYSISS